MNRRIAGGSRAESLALLEDLLNFGISISDEDALSDEELGDLAEDNKIASELDLTPRIPGSLQGFQRKFTFVDASK